MVFIKKPLKMCMLFEPPLGVGGGLVGEWEVDHWVKINLK